MQLLKTTSFLHPLNNALARRILVSQRPRAVHTTQRLFCPEDSGAPAAASQSQPLQKRLGDYNMGDFPIERIRNFSIVAHIDHGKSTLADRLLELTGTIRKDRDNQQVLDKLKIERERGITIKAQTASMVYTYKGQTYLLNLVDTPGHVDFSYEVSRSLAASQGALLLVDASQGIQAQTVANFFLAFENNLEVIPVLNKVDLQIANPESAAEQIKTVFDLDVTDIIKVSAKTGLGVSAILPEVIEKIPPPIGDRGKPFKALLFDSWYDEYQGVICLLSLKDGVLRKGDKIIAASSGKKYEVHTIGVMSPNPIAKDTLYAGQVGFVTLGMKNAKEARVGDTFFEEKRLGEPLPGFKPAKSMVFAGLFPGDPNEFEKLKDSIEKLILNDNSVSLQRENSDALGQGWRVGFLGMLHMDVFRQRLEEEYNASVIVTAPTVTYKIVTKSGEELVVQTPAKFPDPIVIKEAYEPVVSGTIIGPKEFIGEIMTLCQDRRGTQREMTFLGDTRVIMKYDLPLSEIVIDFYDVLKSITAGYASFDYEEAGMQLTKISKLDILLNKRSVDALSQIVHKEKAQEVGKKLVSKLKSVMHQQQFEVIIQAALGAHDIIARERIAPYRKDVTAKLYGGDVTRKMKLLEKQKEGKKRMKMIGNVELSHSAFLEVVKK